VNLLSKGIANLEANEQIQPKEGIRYSLYKNEGWARFKQGRYEEAKAYLEVALAQAEVEPKRLLIVCWLRR
jgi:tetratricopeptide (TPR) repeat protein